MKIKTIEKWITLLYLILGIGCMFFLAYVVKSNPKVSTPVEYLIWEKTASDTSDASSESISFDRINLNTASLDSLCTLKGIGSVLAQRIIDYRTETGGFNSIHEIKNVSGIGEKTFSAIREQITVE